MRKKFVQTVTLTALMSFTALYSSSQPLCLTFISFSATKSGDCAVDLAWTYNQCSTGKYYIEYSLDGSTFYPIGVVASNSNTGSVESYTYTDSYACAADGSHANVYYRIRFVSDLSGTSYFSAVRSVNMGTNCSCINNNTTRCDNLPTLSISGANEICAGTSQTYNISNSAYPVTWSITSGGSYVSITSSSLTSITIYNGSTNAALLGLNANIFGCLNVTKTIMLGTPQTPTDIFGLNPPTPVSPQELLGLEVYPSFINVSGLTYNWTTEGGTVLNPTNSFSVTVEVDECAPQISTGYLNVHINYSNQCGTGDTYTEWTTVDCGTGGGPERIRKDKLLLWEKKPNYVMWPNPVTDYLHIMNVDEPGIVFIKNTSGTVMKSTTINKGSANIYVGDLKPGIYILQINQKEARIVRKIIKL